MKLSHSIYKYEEHQKESLTVDLLLTFSVLIDSCTMIWFPTYEFLTKFISTSANNLNLNL